ncbi:hypothetical protein BLS_002504 [Venturia inaequalis]|uniref:WD40 repeat-like protein n=1 Tax=Venturia inaequalis TaxID=5025 RepID=A0A8H3Z0K4_VENIN|nr:hypothetical protein BLS_002504 [Venturia inaequalis]
MSGSPRRPNFVHLPTAPSTPDRFIPSRDSPGAQTPRESFLLSRPPDRLASNERFTRMRTTSPDPFSNALPSPPRTTRVSRPPVRPVGSLPTSPRTSVTSVAPRVASQGSVWQIGGPASLGDSVIGVSDGRGGMIARGTNAPLYTSTFLSRPDQAAELDVFERRLAVALDIDISSKTIQYATPPSTPIGSPQAKRGIFSPSGASTRVWQDSEWKQPGNTAVLDAPSLRDDYYCSLLAYSDTAKCLAVGLGNHVYLWTEAVNNDLPDSLKTPYGSHVTSLAFSSNEGGKSILAIGRADGRIILWSPDETTWRFDSVQPSPVCCVAFRPQPVKRASKRDRYTEVYTDELLIGDEVGHVYIYSIEWPSQEQRDLFAWNGALTLIARIEAHTQQICGLSWSPDGKWFATGGNDNICHLFQSKKVLEYADTSNRQREPMKSFMFNHPGTCPSQQVINMTQEACKIPATLARHVWSLSAAVKAIAFCPWQRGLVAIGGGSNDRCVHFYHTISGACLATIDCSAQVTSLIWSNTRREIAVTFGFAQPEHPYRIAVFAWPSCKQVVGIPWYDEHRALYAIPYPGGPNTGEGKGEGGVWWNRTQEEGCIVVATSDCSIKFHEVWAEERKATTSRMGMLGGSDILESLHGIDKPGDVIR